LIGAAIAAYSWRASFAGSTEAEYEIPGGRARIVSRIEPMHRFLAEYERAILIVSPDGRKVETRLFPDTGGYKRTQLYRAADGTYYAKGFFDVAHLDPGSMNIALSEAVPTGSSYLGAFDVAGHGWRFLPANESREQSLLAKGG
jgi:hypothetical protein